jgi:hypothetical protein
MTFDIGSFCAAGIALSIWIVFLGWILVRVFKVIKIEFHYEPPAKKIEPAKRRVVRGKKGKKR